MKWILVLASVVVGCSTDHCDKDQIYAHGLCFEPIADATRINADAGAAHFGDACVDPSSCAAPTNFCMIEFGADTGYCTSTGCALDSDCPDGWKCTDLSTFTPGQPLTCTKF